VVVDDPQHLDEAGLSRSGAGPDPRPPACGPWRATYGAPSRAQHNVPAEQGYRINNNGYPIDLDAIWVSSGI
jgi:hypothetical protein